MGVVSIDADAAHNGAFAIDWGELAPLRLKARVVVEGLYAGPHRSNKKGTGVEVGGQRPYVPGDDLRFFDRRALLRHDRLMIRRSKPRPIARYASVWMRRRQWHIGATTP